MSLYRSAPTLALLTGMTLAFMSYSSNPLTAQQSIESYGNDVLRIQEGNPWPEVYYENSDEKTSMAIEGEELEINGTRVKVWVRINAAADGQSERIIVEPLDSQVIAVPPVADVKDGESITILIMPPMF